MSHMKTFLKNSLSVSLALIIVTACTSPSIRMPSSDPLIPSLLAKWTMGKVHDLAWSPDSTMFAVNYWVDGDDSNSFVQAFAVESLSSMWIADNSLATNLAYTPDGQFIVESNMFAPSFYWRSVQQGKVVRQIAIEDLNQIKIEDCRGGGQIIVSNAYDNTVLVADTNNLLGPRTNNVVTIRQWNLETGQCKDLIQYQGSFDVFDLNSTGTLLAFGGEGQEYSIVIWDVEKRAELCRTRTVSSGRFVPGENTLAVMRNQKIIFVDASTCLENKELEIFPSSDYENYLAFSPDGKQFAIARDTIQIMSASTGEMLAQIPFPEKAVPISNKLVVNGIIFSPNGRYLLIAYDLLALDSTNDGEIQLWQLKP